MNVSPAVVAVDAGTSTDVTVNVQRMVEGPDGNFEDDRRCVGQPIVLGLIRQHARGIECLCSGIWIRYPDLGRGFATFSCTFGQRLLVAKCAGYLLESGSDGSYGRQAQRVRHLGRVGSVLIVSEWIPGISAD
jgi:hypothetical protein